MERKAKGESGRLTERKGEREKGRERRGEKEREKERGRVVKTEEECEWWDELVCVQGVLQDVADTLHHTATRCNRSVPSAIQKLWRDLYLCDTLHHTATR